MNLSFKKDQQIEGVRIETLEIVANDGVEGMRISLHDDQNPEWFGSAVGECLVAAFKGVDGDPDFVDLKSPREKGLQGELHVGDWVLKFGEDNYIIADNEFFEMLFVGVS